MAKEKKQKTTTKKVKVIGKEQYINAETGEVEVMDVISVEERDFNFHKLWLTHILNSIDLIGNQKTKLAFWIVDHLNKENQLVYTYEQIQKETEMSQDTIKKTFKALMESNFLQKKHSGCYVINPDVIYKGSRSNRMSVLIQYHDVKQESDKCKFEKSKAGEESLVTDTTDTKITGTMFTTTTETEVEVTDSTVTNATAVEEIPVEVVATATVTPRPGKRPGKAGTPKPDNWEEIKAKILSNEITKKSVWQSLKIASNTLNKWLAEE